MRAQSLWGVGDLVLLYGIQLGEKNSVVRVQWSHIAVTNDEIFQKLRTPVSNKEEYMGMKWSMAHAGWYSAVAQKK